MKESIKILGAGPAGLTAACVLARGGRTVEVFEKRADCGGRFSGDLQGLENWSDSKDVQGELGEIGATDTLFCNGFRQGTMTNGSSSVMLAFDRPLFYLVKRGVGENSLDQWLKSQALAVGARIYFNRTLPSEQADIIATGPWRRPSFVVQKGIVFETDVPDLAVALMNDRAGFKGYSYLLITKGYGCLCTTVFDRLGTVGECFEEAKRILTEQFAPRITNPRPVGGVGHSAHPPHFGAGRSLFVGEAAGVQDILWGFGIRSAMKSGALAARCLLEGHDYREAATSLFRGQVRAGLVNRFLWEALRWGNYRFIMAALERSGPEAIMHSFYRYNAFHTLLYPFAKFYFKNKF